MKNSFEETFNKVVAIMMSSCDSEIIQNLISISLTTTSTQKPTSLLEISFWQLFGDGSEKDVDKC